MIAVCYVWFGFGVSLVGDGVITREGLYRWFGFRSVLSAILSASSFLLMIATRPKLSRGSGREGQRNDVSVPTVS